LESSKKFLAVFGTISPKSPITTRPLLTPPTEISKYTKRIILIYYSFKGIKNTIPFCVTLKSFSFSAKIVA